MMLRHDLNYRPARAPDTAPAPVSGPPVSGPPVAGPAAALDRWLLHRRWGYLIMAGVLGAGFSLIFAVGRLTEPLCLQLFQRFDDWVESRLGAGTLPFAIVDGVVDGVGGGISVVVPYLLTFFALLSLLEASGYLSRIARLLDRLFHRIGLHGSAVVPLLLGFGCTVPGVLATRVLGSRRDKLVAATLTALVPCSARMTIIFALVGAFISLPAALAIYALNAVIIVATGKVLARVYPAAADDPIIPLGSMRWPGSALIARRTWAQLREFVVIAWPLLIAGSIVLELIGHWQLTAGINAGLAGFTSGVLGLPSAVGITLLFGLLRKELALVLVFAALGTSDIGAALSATQILVYVLFVTFYVPCLATVAALARELGWRAALSISAATFGIAVVIAVGVRALGALLG